jgi:hypothetical protein
MARNSYLTYLVKDTGLPSLLHLVIEIRAETGLEPQGMHLPDGHFVDFDYKDAQAVCERKLSEEDYIAKHNQR